MAADSLDMSLDDLITNNKRRSSARRSLSRSATRAAAAPYHAITFQAPPTAYGYGTHPTPNVETTTNCCKLYISNSTTPSPTRTSRTSFLRLAISSVTLLTMTGVEDPRELQRLYFPENPTP